MTLGSAPPIRLIPSYSLASSDHAGLYNLQKSNHVYHRRVDVAVSQLIFTGTNLVQGSIVAFSVQKLGEWTQALDTLHAIALFAPEARRMWRRCRLGLCCRRSAARRLAGCSRLQQMSLLPPPPIPYPSSAAVPCNRTSGLVMSSSAVEMHSVLCTSP